MDACIALCRALIAAESPSGRENEAAEVVARYFADVPGALLERDRYGSVLVAFKGARPGPRLLFDAHLDTVPVINPASWTHAPFGGEIGNGCLYGRGASDMKGALACMCRAVSDFVRKTGGDFAGSVTIAGVVHEECFEGVAAREISDRVRPDYVIIGEASECNLKIGQRGRAELTLEVFGRSAHSANPEAGVNAVYNMAKLIDRIRQLPAPEHPVLGKGILELTDIRSEPYPGASVVPAYCAATYDRRLLVGETPASVLAPIEALIAELAQKDASFTAQLSLSKGSALCCTGETIGAERFFPGWLFSEKEPWIQRVKARLDTLGLAPKLTKYNFCTNGSHYAGEMGIPTLGFGPSCESNAHTADEWIALTELERAMTGYRGILEAMLLNGTGER